MQEKLKLNKQELIELFESSFQNQIFINRFISLMFNNIEDANALILRVKTGLFSSRVLTNDEHSEAVKALSNFNNLTFTKHEKGTLIVDTFHDELGCLKDVYKAVKSLSLNYRIILGVCFIDIDRVVIVKEKFWENENQRPKGYHYINDLS
jgi:hypothetical protein